MRDFRRYWEEIHEIQAGLPEFVWLMSVDGGGAVEAGSSVAARLLHAKSHRVATSEEVVQHQADKSEQNHREAQERLARDGVVVVAI